MDKNKEDTSSESKRKHIAYYKSLSRVIKDIENEIELEKEDSIKNHLQERIKAMKLDKERIEKMFPDNVEEFKDE